jgi:PPOX class probable FMN-dependent enzyme
MQLTSVTPPYSESSFGTHAVTTIDDLVVIIGVPKESTANKQTNFLTPLLVEFLQKSPFYLLATANVNGTCDVSPKGDPAGALYIPDERMVVLPDRLGNRRVDSLKNIVTNPHIGLLFMIPGVDETLRLNGRARITKDPALLEKMPMQGRLPNLAIVVEIDEVFTHCARSILRSQLWQPDSWADPSTVPTMAAMRAEQKNLPAPDESLGKRTEEYRSTLY